ncbi:MAG TPA: divalent-cation tolerance protein CutA [Gemmatimonadales bacterium]|nr:divalent-cation tolerance protein CutA [Gemmatimonadales bacterium]
MATGALVVLTTLSTVEDARQLVQALVSERVIACGTILPAGTSIYRWKNEMKEETETVVLMKTDASRWEALATAVRDRHPYEVPELLALPVERGLEAYLEWLQSEVVT